MQKEILFWLFIGIFTITALITLLGISGVLKSIKEKYLSALFTSLILEVVVAVIFLFKNTDFNEQAIDYTPLVQSSGIQYLAKSNDIEADIKELLRKGNKYQVEKAKSDSLANRSLMLEELLANCNDDVDNLNKNFYTKVYKLKKKVVEYNDFINLKWRPQDKKEVYTLLAEIFENLKLVQTEKELYLEDGSPDPQVIIQKYAQFKKRYYTPVEEEDQVHYSYVFQSDIVQILQSYLDIIKE